jgi:hypothetical protein
MGTYSLLHRFGEYSFNNLSSKCLKYEDYPLPGVWAGWSSHKNTSKSILFPFFVASACDNESLIVDFGNCYLLFGISLRRSIFQNLDQFGKNHDPVTKRQHFDPGCKRSVCNYLRWIESLPGNVKAHQDRLMRQNLMSLCYRCRRGYFLRVIY